ncbi:hypothetical protein TNCV_1797321 [Trichonephila clavipes]|nr:hypothetical protein TNCV_1797321 [Trichonephila clavipes]
MSDFLRFHSLHISAFSIGHFPIVTFSGLDSFLNTTPAFNLLYFLLFEENLFSSRVQSGSLQKRVLLNSWGWSTKRLSLFLIGQSKKVCTRPLNSLASYWSGTNKLSSQSFFNAPVLDVRWQISTLCPPHRHCFLKPFFHPPPRP